jgi:glutamate dehydrogenase
MTRAYAAVRDSFDLLDLNTAIDALDGKIAGATQLSLYRTVQDMALSQLGWFMCNAQLASGSLAETIAVFKVGIGAIAANLDQCLRPAAILARAARAEELVSAGIPRQLSRSIADLAALSSAPDIVLVARMTGKPVSAVAMAHFGSDDALGIGALVAAAAQMPLADAYDRLARDRALAIVDAAHRGLTAKIVELGAVDGEPGKALDSWITTDPTVGRARERLNAIVASPASIAKLTVAAGLLGDLAR